MRKKLEELIKEAEGITPRTDALTILIGALRSALDFWDYHEALVAKPPADK